MGNLNIEKVEEQYKKFEGYLKKQNPLIYIAIFLIILYLTFFGGAFLKNSNFVEGLNLFMILLGEKEVSIDYSPFPNVKENKTIIPFHVKNTGDKDISEIIILYSFCGLEEKKVMLEKKKLYKDEIIIFNLETQIVLNTSCQYYTDKIWADIYEDKDKNCYVDVPEDITENYCSFCKIRFSIYLDGELKKKEIWYPYLSDSINAGNFIRQSLVFYPLNISWKQGYSSECKVLVPTSQKTGLTKKESIGLGFFDTYTMCESGEDIEWCKENFYQK